jgi:hypothetical protein
MKSIQSKSKHSIVKNFLIKETSYKEYGLNSSFFDPSNHSPPNDFMIKLQKRISNYNFSGIKVNKQVTA